MKIVDFEQLSKEKEPNILTFRKQLEWIAYNYKLSTHAEMRIIRRDFSDDDLRTRILTSPLSWKTKAPTTNNECVAIAFGMYDFIVVDIQTNDNGEQIPIVITYINTKSAKTNVIDKFLMDYKAKCRELGV